MAGTLFPKDWRQRIRRAMTGGIVETLIFDPEEYVSKHSDLQQATLDCTRALDHYIHAGRWEGRKLPRRWPIPDRALRWAHEAEARLEELTLRMRPWELAHCLQSGHDGRRVFGRFSPLSTGRPEGPWSTPLPDWARPTGWCVVNMEADVPPEGEQFAVLAPDQKAAFSGKTPLLHCRQNQPASCVLRLPRSAERLIVRPTGKGIGHIRRLQIKPLDWPSARDMMLGWLDRGAQYRARIHELALNQQLPFEEALWETYCESFRSIHTGPTYAQWIERVERPRHLELEEQRQDRPGTREGPRISVLLPVHDPSPALLRECLYSVLEQRYSNWEVCIADDGSRDPEVRNVLRSFAEQSERIKVTRFPETRHVSHATNAALRMATGDYVALLDHDDVLSPYALLEMSLAIERHPRACVLYSDEDKLDADGKRHQPHFKPCFDPDRLLGQNYFGHLLVLETHLLRRAGGFRPGYEGAQDHDIALRCTELVENDQIVHVPHVLYHWRESATSTALEPDAKPYAVSAGLAAVKDALERREQRASVTPGSTAHCYRVRWHLPPIAPSVAIVVPTRDRLQLLSTCIEGILSRTDYPRYQLIVVDNRSVEPETLRYLRDLEGRGVRVLRDDRPFNFSALNNFAVRQSRSNIVALVNNDIEVTRPDWLREMVSHAIRPDVGAVGALLLYPDGRIQHGGVVLGIGGVAGHAFKYLPGTSHGYFSSLHFARGVGAVTAACLVVERSKYEAVGALDEQDLHVAFNDVDFCLKLSRAGYRNVFTPHAVLIHHESATRGEDLTPAQSRRFQTEQRVMKDRWDRALVEDPFYSPHLTLEREDFSLRVPK